MIAILPCGKTVKVCLELAIMSTDIEARERWRCHGDISGSLLDVDNATSLVSQKNL
jgi:hypothetical protein